MKKFTLKAFCYVIGLFLLSLGISLTIKADLGVGAWDALSVGLSVKVGLTTGSWIFIVGAILILINSFLLRKKPDIAAFITVITIGSFIDFWLLAAFANFEVVGLAVKITLLLSGLAILAFGCALYLQAKFARNPVDNFMLAVQYRTGKNLTISKTITELTALVLALIVGGPIGVGTIITTFAVGPLIQMFFTPVERIVNTQLEEPATSSV